MEKEKGYVDKGEDRHENQNGDNKGANWIRDAHVVTLDVSKACVSYLDEEGGKDHPHRAERVGQHV